MDKEIFKKDNKEDRFEFSGAEASNEIKRKVKDNFDKLISELKSREAIPKGGNIHINYDTENGELKSYFIEDKDGKTIKFADLRKNDLFLKIIKEYFRESYVAETGKHFTDLEIEKYIDGLADIYLDEKLNEETYDEIEN